MESSFLHYLWKQFYCETYLGIATVCQILYTFVSKLFFIHVWVSLGKTDNKYVRIFIRKYYTEYKFLHSQNRSVIVTDTFNTFLSENTAEYNLVIHFK